MENIKIYLAGGMSGLSYKEQMGWRDQLIYCIKYSGLDLMKSVNFFSPPDFYNFEEPQHKSEREVFEFDLYNLKKSDLVVVNFNDPKSLGTAMELAIAKENKIPVIGLNEKDAELYPWLRECCTRICDDFNELLNHIIEFYLK